MSLSRDPAFSALRDSFICGTRDIANEPYCGVSGVHDVNSKAINTTNGAGPHNIQMFVLSADGTVLTCLQGFWNPADLVDELALANQLNQVWLNPNLTRAQKDEMFRQMHLAHIRQHSPEMVRRSHLQGFDAKYEAKHRLATSDCILDTRLAQQATIKGSKIPWQAFKTTDQIMHERMAQRPFEPFQQFDVASYVDYGRPKYDKHEDARDANGQVDKAIARNEPQMGNASQMNQMKNQQNKQGMIGKMQRRALRRMMRMGVRAF